MAATRLLYGQEDTMSGIPKDVRYDPSGLIGSPSPVNMIVGARSLGKTYSFMRYGVAQWIKKGNQWVYVRRYDSNLRAMFKLGDFFKPLEDNNEFPEYRLRQRGKLMEIQPRTGGTKQPWHTFGQFIPLSQAHSYKATNAPNVTMLMMDEFIAEKGERYLPDEPDELMGLWETLDRRRDQVRIFMAANAADLVNPYFVQWGLQLPTKGKTKTYRHGQSTITIQYADDKRFRDAAEKTSIGAFTSGSQYERYALSNDFEGDDNVLIAEKPSNAQFRCEIIFKRQSYGVWCDPTEGDWFVSRKVSADPGRESYTLLRRDMRPNTILLDRADPLLKTIKRAIMQGFCYFNSIRTREGFMKGMELVGLR